MKRFKRPVEVFLVSASDATVLSDGATSLVTSTGGTNLANGQLGVFHYGVDGTNSPFVALGVGDTIADSPAIVIAQGTANASSPGPDPNFEGAFTRPYRISAPIYGSGVRAYTGQAYVVPTQNSWLIGADDADGGTIGTPLDETTYSVRVTFNGRRRDMMNSAANLDSFVASYTTPDYTALATVDPLDHLVQNLVYQMNMNSAHIVTNGHRGKYPFIALALRCEGAPGVTYTGTAVSALDNKDGGVGIGSYGITTDAETAASNNDSVLGNTFDLAAAAGTSGTIDTTSQVVDVDLDIAGTGADGANAILIIAMDESLYYEDRVKQRKVDMQVSLKAGFVSTVEVQDLTDPQEGQGTYRYMTLWYKDTEGQREYPANQNRTEFPVIAATVPFSSTANYSLYIIEHQDTREFLVSPNNVRLHKTIVCVPKGDTTTKNALEAVLNPWMASLPNPFPALNI